MVLYSAGSRYFSQEKGVEPEFPWFVRLPIVFFECYLKLFFCFLDVKKPNHFPKRALPWTLQIPSCIMRMFHAHMIWVPSALPISTFFSVLTPDFPLFNKLHKIFDKNTEGELLWHPKCNQHHQIA